MDKNTKIGIGIVIACLVGIAIILAVLFANSKSDLSECRDSKSGIAAVKSNKCFESLKWPFCKPSSKVKRCNDIVDFRGDLTKGNAKETCCLSDPDMKDLKKNNCPPGWTNNPATDWCTNTFKFGLASDLISHKCYKANNCYLKQYNTYIVSR